MAESKATRDRFLRQVLIVETSAVAFGLVIWLALSLRGLLLDFAISVILAIVLDPLVKILTKGRIARPVAVVVVVFIGLSVISGLLYVFSQPVYHAGVAFGKDLPGLVAQAQSGQGRLGSLIKSLHIETLVNQNVSKLTSVLTNFTGPVLSATRTVLSGITGFVTIALLAVFILLEGPGIARGALSLLSSETSSIIRRTLDASQRAVAGYVLGNFATSVIAGVVVGVTLAVLGVPFVLLLSLWVALVDLLPLIGGLLAGVPTVGIALLHSPAAGLITAIVFIAYQQLENHVLNPLIMARTVKLNPLWILVSVLVGAHLAGLLGALIGIPVAAMIQAVSFELWSQYQLRRSGRTGQASPAAKPEHPKAEA